MIDKERLRDLLDELDDLDLPDGAFWALAAERLSIETGEDVDSSYVVGIVFGDPEFFGWGPA